MVVDSMSVDAEAEGKLGIWHPRCEGGLHGRHMSVLRCEVLRTLLALRLRHALEGAWEVIGEDCP